MYVNCLSMHLKPRGHVELVFLFGAGVTFLAAGVAGLQHNSFGLQLSAVKITVPGVQLDDSLACTHL